MFRTLVSKLLLALMLFNTAVCADPIVTGSKPFTFIPGTTISSSQVNADFDYIINQVNTNAAKNGANSSITSLLGLTTPLAPSMGGSSFYYATTVGGTVDAITITATTPAISSFSLVAGVSIAFVPTGTNTVSGPTVNVNGTGAIILKRTSSGGVANLRPGELPIAGGVNTGLVQATYDGTQWIVLNAPALFGNAISIASAATTDLSLAGTRNATITGSVTITSFGNLCSPNFPIYLVKFTGAPAITYNATSMILPGASNAIMSAGDSLLAECLGSGNWKILSIFPLNPVVSMGGVNGFTANNNAGTPNTQVDIAWTGLAALENVAGFSTDIIGPGSKTINAAVTGINGLDTGALANNTWYYIYIISDGASLTAGLMSTSATSPTMPAGYTHKYRVSSQKTGGAATFNRVIQKGNRARYQVVAASVTPALPTIGSGASGSTSIPTWTSVAVSNVHVPTTATSIVVQLNVTGSAHIIMAAPNNGYGAYNSATNPPFVAAGITTGGNSTNALPSEILLESANIFWAGAASALLMAAGWTDSVNAN